MSGYQKNDTECFSASLQTTRCASNVKLYFLLSAYEQNQQSLSSINNLTYLQFILQLQFILYSMTMKISVKVEN